MLGVHTKILFVIDSYHGTGAGTESQLLELIRGLAQKGFLPRMAVLRSTEFTLTSRDFVCPLLTLNMMKMASIKTLFRLFKFSWFLRKEKIQIVHIFFNDAALIIPFFAKLGGCKVVVSRRDMGIWYTRSNLVLLRVANIFVDRIVANSKAVAEYVRRLEGVPVRRIKVIYNGFSFDRNNLPALEGFREQYAIAENEPIVGMVANLRPVKRHRDLLQAFAQVRRSRRGGHLVLVGAGPLRMDLQQLILELGLEGCVHFLEGVTEVIPIVRHFNVGVLCSESEGFSNALIEYMACGVPPVCTKVGGNVELVTDGVNGFLVEVGDVASLTSRIEMLLSDRHLALRFGTKARIDVGRLTIEKMISSHLQAYAELVADPK